MKNTLDEYDKKAREVCPISNYGHSLGCDQCCEEIADALRSAASDALFQANAVYLLYDVPSAHLAAIEVRNRAVALRKIVEGVS